VAVPLYLCRPREPAGPRGPSAPGAPELLPEHATIAANATAVTILFEERRQVRFPLPPSREAQKGPAIFVLGYQRHSSCTQRASLI